MSFKSFKTLFFQIKIHYNKIFRETDAVFKIRYLSSIPLSSSKWFNCIWFVNYKTILTGISLENLGDFEDHVSL